MFFHYLRRAIRPRWARFKRMKRANVRGYVAIFETEFSVFQFDGYRGIIGGEGMNTKESNGLARVSGVRYRAGLISLTNGRELSRLLAVNVNALCYGFLVAP